MLGDEIDINLDLSGKNDSCGGGDASVILARRQVCMVLS